MPEQTATPVERAIAIAVERFPRAVRSPEAATRAWWEAVEAIDPPHGDRTGPQRRFAEDLGAFVEHLAGTPGLTVPGWVSRFAHTATRLENRVRIDRLIAEHPEIEREPIDAPVFVVGLPRTASTTVHRLLAGTRTLRGPLLWEYFHTGLDADRAERDAVVARLWMLLRGMLKDSPEFKRMHPMRPDLPEECHWLLPHTSVALTYTPMPGYLEWLGRRDMREDYRYLRRALQVLQYRREPRRFVLKFPGHLEQLATIAEVFPDASFVWTHRDPATVVESYCELVESLSRSHCRGLDPTDIGGTWLGILADMVRAGAAQRALLPEDRITDLEYRRLAEDPAAALATIAERVGAEWTGADRDRAERTRAAARTRGDRLHRFGLSTAAVEDAFGDYPSMYEEATA